MVALEVFSPLVCRQNASPGGIRHNCLTKVTKLASDITPHVSVSFTVPVPSKCLVAYSTKYAGLMSYPMLRADGGSCGMPSGYMFDTCMEPVA